MIKIIQIFKILFISCLLVFAQQVLASMDSDNYNIWIDTFSAGGGQVESTNYSIHSSLSQQTGPKAQSSNFFESSGFSAIDDEPTVGFNVQSVSLDFGELSSNSTAYSSHAFAAYTNSSAGYTIKVYGDPLKTSYHAITAIGASPDSSVIGTEQFGLNLVSNSVPVIGQNPAGGIGQAAVNYNSANQFAYNNGDIIAQAANYTYQTDYTVSVIVNISDETPSGIYGTILTYEFIPVF